MSSLLVDGGLVSFEEDVSSPQLGLTREARSITRTGRILGANIEAAILECYPAAPAVLGRHPTANWLYVDSLNFEPWHPNPAIADVVVSGGVASHLYNKLSVTYSRLPFDQEPNGSGGTDFLTRRWSFGAEMLTMPAAKLRWASDGTQVQTEDISAAKLIPTIEHSITVHRKLTIPWTAIRANIGKLNDGAWNGADDQTLLFAGGEVSFTFSTDGTKLYTLDLRFQERRIVEGANIYGWNYFFRNKAGAKWDQLKDEANELMYQKSSTFSDLFH
jgi:hypothetical protein